jgi:large subunit ribosomal protein L36e
MTADIFFFHHLQLGTFGRAKRKVDELQRVIAEARRTGAH